MLLPTAFEECLSGICDLWVFLELLITNTKDILNSMNIHCWTGSGDPMSSPSLSPVPLRCILGQVGGCAPIRIFPAALSYGLWEQDTLGKGNGNWTLKSVQEKCSGSQPLGGGSKSPISGNQLYLGLVIQSMVIQNHLPLVCGIAPEVSLKLLDK